jgi:hypothetical protein
MGEACSTMGRRRMHVEYWWESQKERDHYKDLYISGIIILKWNLDRMKCYRLDLMWFWMGASGGLL